MTRSHKILGFLLVTLFGIYGCARGPGDAAQTEKARAEREATDQRVQRLTEDFRAAAAARDQFRQRLLAAEEKQVQLQRQLEATASERDSLRTERNTLRTERDSLRTERDAVRNDLKVRTAERDSVANQYDGFRKNVRDMLDQAETTRNTSPGAPTAPPALMGTKATGPALRN